MKSGDPIVDSLCEMLSTHANDDPLVFRIIGKLVERSKAGQVKYGTTLARKDLSTADWLWHAQMEALDLLNYLQVLTLRPGADTGLSHLQEMTFGIVAELEARLSEGSESSSLPVSKSPPLQV